MPVRLWMVTAFVVGRASLFDEYRRLGTVEARTPEEALDVAAGRWPGRKIDSAYLVQGPVLAGRA